MEALPVVLGGFGFAVCRLLADDDRSGEFAPRPPRAIRTFVNDTEKESRPLRTYGRTKARPLKPRQAALVEALLPHLAVPEGLVNLDALFCEAVSPGGEGAGD